MICAKQMSPAIGLQLPGHKRVDSIEDYHKVASIKNQEEMSRILSENTSSTSRPSTSNTNINMNAVLQQQNESPVSTTLNRTSYPTDTTFWRKCNKTGGTFTINLLTGNQSISPQREFKRVRHIIESDSSQESSLTVFFLPDKDLSHVKFRRYICWF